MESLQKQFNGDIAGEQEEKRRSNGSKCEEICNLDKINAFPLPIVGNMGSTTSASGSALGSLMAATAMSSTSMMSMIGLQPSADEKGPKINPEDIELYKQAFDEFDRNNDGTISIHVGLKD